MQREILFRGKRVDNGEWIESKGFMIHSDGTVIMILSENETGFTTTPVIPETVGQFTGRIDRKGNRIFECDRNQDNGVCIWNAYDASFCWKYKGIGLEPMGEEEHWCEITGNIHDDGTAHRRMV